MGCWRENATPTTMVVMEVGSCGRGIEDSNWQKTFLSRSSSQETASAIKAILAQLKCLLTISIARLKVDQVRCRCTLSKESEITSRAIHDTAYQ